MKKTLFFALASLFLFLSCAQKPIQKESGFRKFPLDKYISYRLDTSYWNLPELKLDKEALAREIKEVHATLVAFHENKLDGERVYKSLMSAKDRMAISAYNAFSEFALPQNSSGALRNELFAQENSRSIFRYRLPTTEETEKADLWSKYVLIGNLYVSSVNIQDNILLMAYIEAMSAVKKHDKKLADETAQMLTNFKMHLTDELKRIAFLVEQLQNPSS